jgi:hypothetical protein
MSVRGGRPEVAGPGPKRRSLPWLCENAKERSRNRTLFSAVRMRRVRIVFARANTRLRRILFSSFCSAARFYTAKTHCGTTPGLDMLSFNQCAIEILVADFSAGVGREEFHGICDL